MALSTTTSLSDGVPSEMITNMVVQEARPFNIVVPLIGNEELPQGQGLVWQKVKLPTTTAASVGESADITATTRTTTNAQVTVAEVGLSTDLTDLSQEAGQVATDVQTWARSQGRAIAQLATSDVCDLFAALNTASAVGTSGSDMTIADFVEAMFTLDSADAPGSRRCVLHPTQIQDLANALTGSGAIFANLPELIRNGNLPDGTPSAGFWGLLFGVPIYQTTECPTANSAADRVGAMFVEEAMQYVELRPIRVEQERDASARVVEIVVTAAYGVGEVVDGYGVPIVTDA